jgi:hypothetical protein
MTGKFYSLWPLPLVQLPPLLVMAASHKVAPKTELNDETGQNCQMTFKEFQEFGHLVFGLDSYSLLGSSKHSQGFRQTDYSFLIMLLIDCTTIMNLHPMIASDIKGECPSLARALAQCTLLLLEQKRSLLHSSSKSGERMTL